MNFNRLNSGIKWVLPVLAFCFFIISCTDQQSANNSTPGANENNSDTSAVAKDATPVTNKKKSGKITTSKAEDSQEDMVKDKQGIYNRAEVLPAFAGGEAALENYIVNTIEYPQDAIDNNIEGVVKVRFAVDEKGNISNVSTIGEKIGHGLEEEAIDVVTNMPKWTPGQIKGKNVKTWRTLPINYRLEG